MLKLNAPAAGRNPLDHAEIKIFETRSEPKNIKRLPVAIFCRKYPPPFPGARAEVAPH
jgi:hypothetical protein